MIPSLKVFFLFICFLTTVLVYAKINQKCGRTPIPPNIESKIIGGRLAKPYSWPWQIVYCVYGLNEVKKRCDIDCGGTIIGKNWIMTAGHCVEDYMNLTQTIRIVTGAFDEAKRNESGEVVHKIKAIHLHPRFYMNDTGLGYDIALLELFKPIKYDNHTQPICLPNQDSKTAVEPNTAWVTGWGHKNDSHLVPPSRLLRQVNVPFVNANTCEKEYHDNIWKFNEKVMVCAGRAGKADCYGDSGGPLVVKNKNNAAWFQYGIVSWAKRCALKGFPGVFSRVIAYCDFIEDTTKGALSDPIKFDNHTQPICLPIQDTTTIIEPNTAWATGWGMKNASSGDPSRLLRQVNIPFVNVETCKKEYPNGINGFKFVEKVMICAGRGGKSTCHGDSGGPLVVKNKNNAARFQYGITSWAYGCALKGYPSVFSRVTAYCDFIESTTNGAVKCQNPDTYF